MSQVMSQAMSQAMSRGSVGVPQQALHMNQVEFERRAAEVLETLFDQVEDQLGDWLDVEMTGGILQIELPDGGT